MTKKKSRSGVTSHLMKMLSKEELYDMLSDSMIRLFAIETIISAKDDEHAKLYLRLLSKKSRAKRSSKADSTRGRKSVADS